MERLGKQEHQLGHVHHDQVHCFQTSCGVGFFCSEQQRRERPDEQSRSLLSPRGIPLAFVQAVMTRIMVL
jgi:hypothetical protein